MSFAIGVDIGGTKIAFALVDAGGNVHAQHRVPTQPDEGVSAVLDRIADGIRQIMIESGQTISGIGIGSPGLVDPKTGIVYLAVNLNWKEVSLRDAVARRLRSDLPIYVQRDTNAAAVGEYLFGAAKGTHDFAHFAVGTGLGMGAVANGKLLNGVRSMAMEMGHVGQYPNGRLCTCGLRGCPEMYVSGVGLLASLGEYGEQYPESPLAHKSSATTGDILDAASQNDPLALKIIDSAAEALGSTMTMCAVALNPELIVIGGGLGLALYDRLLPKISRIIRERTLSPVHESLRFAPSQITASAVGAAALVWYYGG
jgi:glucokinase